MSYSSIEIICPFDRSTDIDLPNYALRGSRDYSRTVFCQHCDRCRSGGFFVRVKGENISVITLRQAEERGYL